MLNKFMCFFFVLLLELGNATSEIEHQNIGSDAIVTQEFNYVQLLHNYCARVAPRNPVEEVYFLSPLIVAGTEKTHKHIQTLKTLRPEKGT